MASHTRCLVICEHDHGKNPDSVQNRGSLGGMGPQTSSQGKREKVLDAKGCCVRLLPERRTYPYSAILTPGPFSMRRCYTARNTAPRASEALSRRAEECTGLQRLTCIEHHKQARA
jgi:hypothetical protein